MPLTPGELYRTFAASARQAKGLDGRGAEELALLPRGAFRRLGELLWGIEEQGTWPEALLHWK
eukprot:13365094-Alexandrium_andersonii.AAC.1